MKTHVKQGDSIILIDEKHRKYLVDTTAKTDKIKGVGVIDPATLIDKQYGKQYTIGSKKFWILPPSLPDRLQTIKRKAQIILPKDTAHIIINCSIQPGSNVLEAGIGSAALTTALATMVAPTGSVISYETRQDFITHAQRNLTQHNLQQVVTIVHQDVTEKINEKNLDAIILDIPNPWNVITHAWNALKPGGYLCTYSPLISQVEQTVHTIRKHPFIELKTLETIQREMIISDHGTRPSFDMLGHTGYLTFARKILS